MKHCKYFAALIVASILAMAAGAVQRDTNATTTASAYTPKAPGDVLVGQYSNAPAFWIAGIGATTNDWQKLPVAGATTNFTILKSTGVTGTVYLVDGVITNKP